MELPGFRCPSDKYTYTIMIGSYCKHSLQTGSRKAIRRRLWEANHLFRMMLFMGFAPDIMAYNCLIDGCCTTYKIGKALELFEDMNKRSCEPGRAMEAKDFLTDLVDGGSIPREYMYKLVCDALDTLGESNLLDDEMHMSIES
ncbi:hypothetical protein Nepgr_002566 [Nepenthes gracilis]|uniref:Pentatricopeptide repeat-containing protein n=1 Tax=Nepenthes gracilis TaxID=150966 RepID=A0AAD3PA43_NEPGR|nr:hypothetical protein Nepgr_002566 [Nepenthes gracilis]